MRQIRSGPKLEHQVELLELTIVFLTALICGLLMQKMRQPPLVGYILAGVLLGPSAFELVTNKAAVRFLAELGAILLMFVVGMELSLRGFRRVYKLTLSVVALQTALGLLVTFAFGWFFDWPSSLSIVLGFAFAISSTAVGVNMLEEIGELRGSVGGLAVGILIAQDLAVIPMLVIVGGLGADGTANLWTLVRLVGAISFLAWFVYAMSRRRRISLPFDAILKDGKGVTALAALTLCFLFATVSGLLGVTVAFGAFVAGLLIGNSQQRAQFIAATLPVRDTLLMIFFLSIGLLIDVRFLYANAIVLVPLVILVLALKTVGNLLILHGLGQPWVRSIRVATILPQMGEFSFILGATGLAAGAISIEGYRLLVAVIALTLIASPLWLASSRHLSNARWLVLLAEFVARTPPALVAWGRAGVEQAHAALERPWPEVLGSDKGAGQPTKRLTEAQGNNDSSGQSGAQQPIQSDRAGERRQEQIKDGH
jgi:CPA2 family monovalent cation:H+ antiporter-2